MVVTNRSWRRAGAVALLGLCTGAGVTSYALVSPAPEPVAAATLPRFDDCEALRSWYAAAALRRVTAWGLSEPPFLRDVAFAAAERAPTTADAVGNGDTGTNLQEANVDEADVAKTDGEQVVSVSGGDLVITDVTGSTPVERGRLTLPPRLRSGELLVDGDVAVVIGWTYLRSTLSGEDAWLPSPARPARTLIARVDLTDPTAPRLTRLDRVEGELVSAREHEGIVRVVVGSAPDLPFVTPGRGRSVREALAENRRVVRTASAEDWLPQWSTLGAGGKAPLFECSEVGRPTPGSDPGTVTVLTLDAGDDTDPVATGIAAEADVVYASADRLYIATHPDDEPFVGPVPRWSATGSQPPPQRTQLYAFDTSGMQTAYVASGTVDGTVEDRWSLSEHEGRLRVAATRGPLWQPTHTAVSVLEESGDRLTLVGEVGGLGRGEQLKAVRWFGDTAVVVTFRQIDPLYVLDLSDPTSPEVTGELKIPGYSGYLHPLGADQLLGIGQAGNARGWLSGPQAATFDVTDGSAPVQLDTADLAGQGTSPVEQDARAFTYLPELRLAFIPVGGWGVGGTAVVPLEIRPDGDLVAAGDPIVVPDGGADVRTLPLGGSRLALVAGGQVVRIVDAAAM